jgi:WD40-like Beta Propeller Repeat
MNLVAIKTASIRSQCMERAALAGWKACVAVLVTVAPAVGQAPPGTDILIADLGTFNGVYYLVGDPKNITRRPEAYDNQPFFTPDSRSILFTAGYEDGNDGQTEIQRYYVSADRITRITRTDESEYSPTPVPGDRAFSAIRVEADSTQRLWRFTMEGMDPEVVLPDLEPVGYHAWADPNTLLLFVLGDPSTLRLADLRTGRVEIVAENVGRSIHKIPTRNAFSFTQRVSDDEAWITELDPNTKETTPLIRTLSGGDFHAWAPDGTLLMADGGSIYQWNPALAEGWQLIADLEGMGLDFSRLAVSPDGTKIAVVGQATN